MGDVQINSLLLHLMRNHSSSADMFTVVRMQLINVVRVWSLSSMCDVVMLSIAIVYDAWSSNGMASWMSDVDACQVLHTIYCLVRKARHPEGTLTFLVCTRPKDSAR